MRPLPVGDSGPRSMPSSRVEGNPSGSWSSPKPLSGRRATMRRWFQWSTWVETVLDGSPAGRSATSAGNLRARPKGRSSCQGCDRSAPRQYEAVVHPGVRAAGGGRPRHDGAGRRLGHRLVQLPGADVGPRKQPKRIGQVENAVTAACASTRRTCLRAFVMASG